MVAERPAVPEGPYLVAGLGRAGQAAVEALSSVAGPGQVSAWDQHETAQLRSARERIRAMGVRVSVGDFGQALDGDPAPACMVKSPGIPFDAPLLAAAESRGIVVLDELELGWRLSRAPVVGITGTNGKSTVAHLAGRCLDAAGRNAVVAGNFDQGPPYSGIEEPAGGWAVCEVSSFQLAASPRFLPEIAVLTNLTGDHLRRHGGWDAYWACKRRMFVRGDRAVEVAILNGDDGFGRKLAAGVRARGGRVITYGAGRDADYRVTAKAWALGSGLHEVSGPGDSVAIESRLPGPHNALNVAAALAVADTIGVAREASLSALSTAPGLPGRFEPIDEGQEFDAVVDFAHTPDAVRQALATAREVVGSRPGARLVVVMGVAGQSDPDKRGAMGEAAAELADVAILTTASTRGEARSSILAGLLEGVRRRDAERVLVESDRGEAIALAARTARPGDLVIVLCRGPLGWLATTEAEDGFPFDDREVLREAIRRRNAPGVTAR